MGGNTQKLDAVVEGKFPDDMDFASIFSKVISHKLSGGSNGELYLRRRMNFVGDVVQIQTPKFIDLEFATINTFYESSVLSTPANRILRPTNGSHWSAPDHVFDEATAVGMSVSKSDHDYKYRTEF